MPIAPKTLNEIVSTNYSLTDFNYVDGFFAPNQFTYLTGQPGSGKSFVLYELALCLVSGRPFMDRKINKRANCLLVDGEMGEARCGRRLQRMMAGAPGNYDGEFFLDAQGRFRLEDRDERGAIIQWMIDNGTDVLLIDSLTRIVGRGLEENSSKDMAEVNAHFNEIRDLTGCSIMVIHHSTKSHNPLRGSSELLAQADNVFIVEERTGARLLTPVKTRDSSIEDGIRAAFTIKSGKNEGISLITVPIPQKSAAYGHDLRERIAEYIRKNPGKSSREIREAIKCAFNTLLQILTELEAEGEIMAVKMGRARIFNPS